MASKSIATMTIQDHIDNAKSVVFETFNDIKTEPLTTDIFVKDNRIFYFGLILIIIYVILLILFDL